MVHDLLLTRVYRSSLVEGLEFPTTMAFLDANDILVLEKNKGTAQRTIDGNKQDEPT
jgi:hypothetical protein